MRTLCLLFLAALSSAFSAFSLRAETASVWSDFQTREGIAYLLRKSPAQIMRYNMADAQWMEPLSLSEIPYSFAFDENYIYLSFADRIERIDHDGSNAATVTAMDSSARELLVDGNLLFANKTSGLYARLKVFEKSTGDALGEFEDYVNGVAGASLAPTRKRIFGRSEGYSPSDINYVDYNDAGELTGTGESPYHGDYPGASRTWVFPDENKVVDDSGTVYNAADLTFNNSFGAQLDALTFFGSDLPIALSDGELISFSNALLETGRYTLAATHPVDIALEGETVFVFHEDETQVTEVGVESVDLAELTLAEAGEPVSPHGLAYEVDATAMDDAGVLYLLSKTHSSLFRWDTETQEYLETIPLPEACSTMAYSESLNRLYLFAPPRKLFRVDLDEASPSAVAFANVPQQINELIPLDTDLLALQNGSWDSQWIYDQNGALLNSSLICCYYDFHFYDQDTGLIYLDNHKAPYLGGGEIGDRETFGGYNFSPLALSPNKQVMLDTGGLVYSAATGEEIDALSNSILSAGWDSTNQLFTVENPGYNNPTPETTVQSWSEYYLVDQEVTLNGAFVAFFVEQDQLVCVTSIDGAPAFSLLTPAFDVVPPSSLADPELVVEKFSATAARLGWGDINGEQEYVLERQSDGNGWSVVATLPYGTTSHTDASLTTGSVYQYRLKAVNGDLQSGYSDTAEVDLTTVVDDRIDPTTVSFIPNDVLLSVDDALYLLSAEHASIFVWSAVTQKWLPTIPLEGAASMMTYSREHDALYTLYQDGTLNSIGLAAENPVEIPFAELTGGTAIGLVAAGEYVIANVGTNSWNDDLISLDAVGNVVDQVRADYPINKGVWSPTRRAIYHLRDGTSPNDLIMRKVAVDGALGASDDSPYHSSSGMQHPVRVHPNGSIVVLGSGNIYDALSLELLDTLPKGMSDAVWMNGQLFTLSDGVLIAWDTSQYIEADTQALTANPKRIFATASGKIVLVGESAGQTYLELLDASLDTLIPATPSAPQGLRAVRSDEAGLRLVWSDVSGETGYEIERSDNEGATWTQVGATAPNETVWTDTSVEEGDVVRYRIIADFTSTTTTSAEIDLDLSAPDQVGNVEVDALSETELEITWSSATGAVSYRVERSEDQSYWYSAAEVDASTLVFVDSGLYRGSYYYYRVIAEGPFTDATPSAIALGATLTDPPEPPTSLAVQVVGALQAIVTWNSSSEALGYRLERAAHVTEGTLQWEEVYEVTDPDGGQQKYHDRSLEPETGYLYRVFAYNLGGDSTATVSSVARTAALAIPEAPEMSVAQLDADSVSIQWHPVVDAHGYVLYRKINGESEWTQIGSFDALTKEFVDTGLEMGQTARYAITASNALGESPVGEGTDLVIAAVEQVFAEDFEEGLNHAKFGYVSGYASTSATPGIGTFVIMESGYRQMALLPLDLRYGGTIVFDFKRLSQSSSASDPVKIAYFDSSSSGWTPITSISTASSDNGDWTRYSVAVPEAARQQACVLSWNQDNSYYSNSWAIDNIVVQANLPEAPQAPAMAVAHTGPAGGTAIFWLPSSETDSYRIERSPSGAEEWSSVGTAGSTDSTFVDRSGEPGVSYDYRMIAINKGGESGAALTGAGASDPDLDAAFTAGQDSVIADPAAFGLSPAGVTSYYHYLLTGEQIEIDGDLLTQPWILYKSSDMENWTPHQADIRFDLQKEGLPKKIYLRLQPAE